MYQSDLDYISERTYISRSIRNITLVFGSPLSVPGEMIQLGSELPAPQFLRRFRSSLDTFSPLQPQHHSSQTEAVPNSLRTSDFVFIRHGAVGPPLSKLYDGPYKVLSRNNKFFRLQIGSRTDSVSIDRLKPAFPDSSLSPAVPPLRGRPRKPPTPPTLPPTLPKSPTSPTPPTAVQTLAGQSSRPPAHFSPSP